MKLYDMERLRRFEADCAQNPTYQLEQMLYIEKDQYTDESKDIVSRLLQSRTDRCIGVTERVCVNCSAINDINAMICGTCGLACGADKSLDVKTIRTRRRDWIYYVERAGLVFILLGLIASFITGNAAGTGFALLLFSLALSLVLSRSSSVRCRRILIPEITEKMAKRRRRKEDILYVICPKCKEQVFCELDPAACPTCGESFFDL